MVRAEVFLSTGQGLGLEAENLAQDFALLALRARACVGVE